MEAVAAPAVVGIDLIGNCTLAGCLKMAGEMRMKLDVPNYTVGVAIMPMPESVEAWRAEHRTARKRADRCRRLGYEFGEIDRSQYEDDLYRINTSLTHRQGRPMSEGYLGRPSCGRLPDYPCQRHAIRAYGVLEGDTLRAYLTLHRVGELGLVSMILGDGSDEKRHLEAGIMYLLYEGLIADQSGLGGTIYYNRWDSGESGLRFYKQRVGFAEGDVRWEL